MSEGWKNMKLKFKHDYSEGRWDTFYTLWLPSVDEWYTTQMSALGYYWWIVKPYYRSTPLVISGTWTHVLADSVTIAASEQNMVLTENFVTQWLKYFIT